MNFLKSQNTIIRSKNNFKKIQPTLDISSPILFPELSANIQNKETTDLNFLEATTLINDEKKSNEPWEIKSGWVYLTKNIEDNNTTLNDSSKEVDKISDNFSQMILNWENYKKHYEEINGEGSYERTYGVYDYDEEFFEE